MAIGAYVSSGTEFLVNTTTSGLQTDVTVAALADGGFIASWTDNSASGQDASGAAIRAQRYDSHGLRVGSEFLVNTTTTNGQTAPSVTALASGGFVVSWTDASGTGADSSQLGVKAQIYDASGSTVGHEFLANTTTTQNQNASSITSLANGGFVVSWTDASGLAPDASYTGVRAQIYGSNGAKVGGEFLVNSTITNAQNFASITGLSGGGFVATWTDSSGLGGDSSATSVKAQRFSASGAKLGAEFLINSTTAQSQDQPGIASLDGGGFVVVWRDTSLQGDTSGSGIKAQIFDGSGVKQGGEFLVNTTEYNTQDQPVVTAIPGAGFAVSWRDNSYLAADASGFGIKAQVFDVHGDKLGAEFQVNTTTTGNQELPAIAALASGALVIGWSDASGRGGDTDGGIKAQIFAPTSGAITDLVLSKTVISEATMQNTAVASIAAHGAYNSDFTYAVLDDSTGGAFGVRGDQLIVLDSLALDYETAPTATLTVRATDTFGNTFDKVFTLSIADDLVEHRYSGGEELLANTSIASNQQQASVAALPGGRYVISWTDGSGTGGDASGNSVKAQIVDAEGAKIGGEFRVNTQTLGSQDSPAVTSLANGGFAITWIDSSGVGGDTSGSGIKAQVYDGTGTAVGGEVLVNSSTMNAQKTPTIASLSGGGFVVTWADSSLQGGDSSVSSVKAQLFDQTGARIGGETLVNTNTLNGQDTPVVAGLAGGGYVISWHDSSQIGGDTSKDAVKAQLFSASGTAVGAEFLVNTQTLSNQQQEAVAGLASGGFVIAWADASGNGGDNDNYGIKIQLYDAAGVKLGVETLVNTSTAGAQIAPTVTALSNGEFMVSWADYGGTGPEAGTAGIKGQLFAADGGRIGDEVVVNSQTLSLQVDPAVVGGANGQFAAVWTDHSGLNGDDSGTSIALKLFDPLGMQGPPPPLVAGADVLSAIEDTPATLQAATLLANDVDSLGLTITLSSVTSVLGGKVTLNPDDTISFTPDHDFSGNALFTYIASDAAGYTTVGRVTIAVAGVNDAPTAVNDTVTVAQDGGTIRGSVLTANDLDPDPGDTKTIQPLAAASALNVPLGLVNGDVVYAAGSRFAYLAAGQTLSDSFIYTIVDQGGLTSTATVSLVVTGKNDAPTGLALTGDHVDENAAGGTFVGTLAASDIDQGSYLTYSLVNDAGGRFTVDPMTGAITVTVGAVLDYEIAPTQSIVARATDDGGLFVDSGFVIALNNLPEPKSWTGDGGVNVFTAPTNDLWTIDGLGGNDVLTGNASADKIYGGAGNDTIDGAGGIDTMIGGIGNDTYYVDNTGDIVTENYGEGTDIVYASVSYALSANIENLTMRGTANISFTGNELNNTVVGNSGDNLMYGGLGADLLQGGDGNDTLWGQEGGDYLQGGNGNDLLVGGAGSDELTGGAGADRFRFDSLTTSADRDKIKDFTPGEDLIEIDHTVFAAFAGQAPGALPAGSFAIGYIATTADQHLIYTPSNGNMYYDPDGAGGAAQVQIALLSTMPTLTSSSFVLI